MRRIRKSDHPTCYGIMTGRYGGKRITWKITNVEGADTYPIRWKSYQMHINDYLGRVCRGLLDSAPRAVEELI